MSHPRLLAVALGLPFFVGCGIIPDIHLGASDGVPPISGSTKISVPQDYKCGDAITQSNAQYKVTSSGSQDACTFTFSQSVTAIKASDYSNNIELQGAQVVNGIDIDVSKFAITDTATGKQPTGLQDLTGTAFGETILTKADLSQTPPFTKTISGAPIDSLKAEVQAEKDVVIPIKVIAVVALTPTPPAELALDFQAQPELDIGF